MSNRHQGRLFRATACRWEILIPPPGKSFSPTPLGCTKKSIPPPCHSHHPSWQPHLISLPSFICQNQILIGLRCDGANVNTPWHTIKWSWIQPPAQHTAGRAWQGEPSGGVSGAPHRFGQPQRLHILGAHIQSLLHPHNAHARVNAHTQVAHKHIYLKPCSELAVQNECGCMLKSSHTVHPMALFPFCEYMQAETHMHANTYTGCALILT